MTFLAKLSGVALILMALCTGGCSIIFSGLVFRDLTGAPAILLIWAAGLVVAVLGLWGGIALLRYRAPAPAIGDRPDDKDTPP
jgi:hypothetical protein